jgi:sigma-B regulation protein RsbU (phosphoserine phosphatase)
MPADSDFNPDHLEADAEELYQHAPCAYLSTLPDGRIIRANHTLLEWLGRTSDWVVGARRFPELLTIGSRIYYETHYSPLLQIQGFVNEIALEMRRADGG